MLKSLYSGVSGLGAHQTKMDVIGNNIANVSTYGFKASRVTFTDIYYQNVRNATAGSATSGGNNPSQVGYGATVGSIDTIMSRSGFQMTDAPMDLAIAGDGFFQVQDQEGNIFYTRAGVFNIDNYGNLVDAQGNFVLGITGDPTDQEAASGKIQVVVPPVEDASASAEKTLEGSTITFSVADTGEQGNISVTFVHSDTPSATLSGGNLTINFDQNKQYNSISELQAAIDEAIALGGVTLPAGGITISADPDPGSAMASASGTVNFTTGGENATLSFSSPENGNVTFGIGAPESATITGGDVAFTLEAGRSYTQAQLQALITGAGSTDITVSLTSPMTAEDLASATVAMAGATAATGTSAIGGATITATAGNTDVDNNGTNVIFKTGATNPGESAVWSGKNLTITLDATQTYDQAAIDAIIAGATGVEPADLGGLTVAVTGTIDATTLVADQTLALTGATTSTGTFDITSAGVNSTLTVTAGTEGEEGNGVEIEYKTVANNGTNTASAEWTGDQLVFTLLEGVTYDDATLNALVDQANLDAGVTTGDVRDITLSLSNPILSDDLASKPFKLGGGENTFATNIATKLGTVILEGGTTASEQTHGNLTGIAVGNDGVITGTHSVHGIMTLGRIDLVKFDNPNGLEEAGNTYFVETPASGEAKAVIAGQDGSGEIVSNSLEMSNVDLAQEFADMITTQRAFQANSRIITTSDTMLEELINLKR